MYEGCKDRSPYQTILFAQKFLLKNNILVTEKWNMTVAGLYSVHLKIDGTKFFANGKGVTKVLALASGYGELMERLQNMAFFRMDSELYEDEIIDFAGNIDLIKWEELLKKKFDTKQMKIIEAYSGLGLMNCSSIIYKNIDDNSDLCLPVKLVNIFYGTNGMAAGNTYEECLVQGYSEILERYVTACYIRERRIATTIRRESLLEFPQLLGLIEKIEKEGTYTIKLKDMSLGKDIPAVGLILYNNKTLEYFVKVAVHPVFEIAIQRCFTELMQGKTLENYTGLRNIFDTLEDAYDFENVMEIFKNGSGDYPVEFILGENDHIFKSQHFKHYVTNQEMKEYLEELIKKLGYQIYIQDVTCSEIKSVHILIPGMSEIFVDMNNLKLLEDEIMFRRIKALILNKIGCLTKEDANVILSFMESIDLNHDCNMADFLRVSKIRYYYQYKSVSVRLFMSMLYILCENFDNAAKLIEEHQKKEKNHNAKMYYKCYALLLRLKKEKKNITSLRSSLNMLFSEVLVDKVSEDIEKYPFSSFDRRGCDYKCLECTYHKQCVNEKEYLLYKKMMGIRYEKAI